METKGRAQLNRRKSLRRRLCIGKAWLDQIECGFLSNMGIGDSVALGSTDRDRNAGGVVVGIHKGQTTSQIEIALGTGLKLTVSSMNQLIDDCDLQVGDECDLQGDDIASIRLFKAETGVRFEFRKPAAPFFDAAWYTAHYPASTRQNSGFLSPLSYYIGASRPPEAAAALQQLRMEDAIELINKLAVLLPEEQREVYKAKTLADFEAAVAGITAPSSESPLPAVLLSQGLAEFSGISTDDAKTVVDAMPVGASILVEASRKILKRKLRLSIKNIPDSELNDPTVIEDAHKFANAHRYTSIAALPEHEANKLRRARLIQKYDIDRRQKTAPAP